jgi:hypothetical protein
LSRYDEHFPYFLSTLQTAHHVSLPHMAEVPEDADAVGYQREQEQRRMSLLDLLRQVTLPARFCRDPASCNCSAARRAVGEEISGSLLRNVSGGVCVECRHAGRCTELWLFSA